MPHLSPILWALSIPIFFIIIIILNSSWWWSQSSSFPNINTSTLNTSSNTWTWL